MSGSDILGIAVSGLRANAFAYGVVANNVVNANSPDHQPREVRTISQVAGPDPGGARAVAVDKGDAQVDVAGELVSMIQIETGYAANAKIANTAQELSGSLLGILA